MGLINIFHQDELGQIATKVHNLQTKCDLYEHLLGEIIATFSIERNQEHIHPKLKEFAEIWNIRFKQALLIQT